VPQNWKEWSDEDLPKEAQEGVRGQGAVVEMMRRLKDSTLWLSRVNLALALVMAIAAVIQIVYLLKHW
jgi:hypothetical protein